MAQIESRRPRTRTARPAAQRGRGTPVRGLGRLAPGSRDTVAVGLQNALAATFRVYRDTHLVHFNIKGPLFPQLHLLLDGQYKEIWNAMDVVAERIRGLGDNVRAAAFQAKPFEVPDDARAALEHLAGENRTIAQEWNRLFVVCDRRGDQGSADLCAGRIRAHDQHAWMLEVTLEGWGDGSVGVTRRAAARTLP